MSVLSLELFEVTAYQALVELRRALSEHGDTTVRISGEDDTVRHNVLRFLEREGRAVKILSERRPWQLEIPPGATLVPLQPAAEPLAALPVPRLGRPKPLMLLRSGFAPGDRALGRRLLLDLLRSLEGLPWLGLAHEALELLEDPTGRAVLSDLHAGGLRIRISLTSLAYTGSDPEPFEPMEDREWMGPAARGELTLL